MKICNGCSNKLSADKFSKWSRSKDGLQPRCKRCNKKYNQLNRKKVIIERREYYLANKESMDDYNKFWREANPGRAAEYTARRKALKQAQFVEKVDYNIVRHRDSSCYLCLTVFSSQERFNTSITHVDHIIPLINGGTHEYKNCALTHKKCNLAKGTKSVEEYLATRTYL